MLLFYEISSIFQLFSTCFPTLPGNESQRTNDPQPETKAMMNFIRNGDFTLSVTLDGGALVVTYPYNKPVQTGNMAMQSIFLCLPIFCSMVWKLKFNCDVFFFYLAVENEATLKYLAKTYTDNHPKMHLGDTLCFNNGQSTT